MHGPEDILVLAELMLAHLDAGTTDMAPSVYHNPDTRYGDEYRWQLEVDRAFPAFRGEQRGRLQTRRDGSTAFPPLARRACDGLVRR
jgi:hypothetical protein